MRMLLLLLAPTAASTSCNTGAATLELTLRGEGRTEPGLWSNVSTVAALTERVDALGADALEEAFRLPSTRAWAINTINSIDPGYNLTNIATGKDVEVIFTVADRSISGTTRFTGVIALTWVAPNRSIGGYPSEPSSQSTPGLHLLHYDTWDRHGNRADRLSRLVQVVQPTDEEENGLAGCRCLRIADITEEPSLELQQGQCGEGTFMYALDLEPGHPKDISCYPNNFGETCAAWELLLPPTCAYHHKNGTTVLDHAPSFCRDSWCYVDEEKCNRSDIKPSKRFNGLHYSYGTCGNTDLFSDGNTSFENEALFVAENNTDETEALFVAENDTVETEVVIVGLVCGVVLLIAAVGGAYILRTHLAKSGPFNFETDDGGFGSEIDQLLTNGSAQRRVPLELHRSCVVITGELGKGASGEVNKALYTMQSAKNATVHAPRQRASIAYTVAVKKLNASSSEHSRREFMREAAISAQFSHSNVIGLIGVVTRGEPALLVLEFCEKGSLDGLLKKECHPQDRLASFVVGIADGMTYLAAREFVHRDLASRNVLVDAMWTPKVADFGLSRDIGGEEFYTSGDAKQRLPLRWCAPEVFSEQKFGEASDVFAFGVTVTEVFSKGATPYRGWTTAYVCERVAEGYQLPRPESCPLRIYYEVLSKCLNLKPCERPTFAKIGARLKLIISEQLDAHELVSAKSSTSTLDALEPTGKTTAASLLPSRFAGDNSAPSWRSFISLSSLIQRKSSTKTQAAASKGIAITDAVPALDKTDLVGTRSHGGCEFTKLELHMWDQFMWGKDKLEFQNQVLQRSRAVAIIDMVELGGIPFTELEVELLSREDLLSNDGKEVLMMLAEARSGRRTEPRKHPANGEAYMQLPSRRSASAQKVHGHISNDVTDAIDVSLRGPHATAQCSDNEANQGDPMNPGDAHGHLMPVVRPVSTPAVPTEAIAAEDEDHYTDLLSVAPNLKVAADVHDRFLKRHGEVFGEQLSYSTWAARSPWDEGTHCTALEKMILQQLPADTQRAMIAMLQARGIDGCLDVTDVEGVPLTAAEAKMLSVCTIEARNKFMTDLVRHYEAPSVVHRLASHGNAALAVAPGLAESMCQQQHQSSVV